MHEFFNMNTLELALLKGKISENLRDSFTDNSVSLIDLEEYDSRVKADKEYFERIEQSNAIFKQLSKEFTSRFVERLQQDLPELLVREDTESSFGIWLKNGMLPEHIYGIRVVVRQKQETFILNNGAQVNKTIGIVFDFNHLTFTYITDLLENKQFEQKLTNLIRLARL